MEYEEEESMFEGTIITEDFLPIMDYPERWSSTYFFLKRGLKLRPAIDDIAEDQDLRKNKIQPDEWDILQEVFLFLEEFALVTAYIEGSEYPTLSLVLPMYNQLLNLLEDVSRDEKKNHLIVQGAAAGLLQLSSYYDKSSPMILAATFMDPRCKMKYFVDHGWSSGGETNNSYSDLDEDLITARVKPA